MSSPKTGKKKRKEANPLPWVMLVIALIIGGIWFVSRGSKGPNKPKAVEQQITISLPPPPAPPPPPPPPPAEPPPPEEEEIAEEEPIDINEPPPEAPAPDPGPDLGTNVTNGNGPDLGLTRGGGNGRIGGGGGKGGRGSVFNRYALRAKTTIEQALRNDPVTRKAIINGLKIEFWPSSDGSILRAKVIGGSGNSELDLAVKRVLTGLRTEPAANPAEMPPSVRIRITSRKPAI